jgi:hypothetical protein
MILPVSSPSLSNTETAEQHFQVSQITLLSNFTIRYSPLCQDFAVPAIRPLRLSLAMEGSPWFDQFSHYLFPPSFLNWLPPLDGSHLSRRMAPGSSENENGHRKGPAPSYIQVRICVRSGRTTILMDIFRSPNHTFSNRRSMTA